MAKKRGRPRKVLHAPPTKKEKVTAVAKVVERDELTEAAINKAFDLLGIGAKLDPQSRALFVEIAKLHRLNPLKREIHAVTMGGKLVPVVGYEVYIQRARNTGLLQYWRVEESGEGDDYKATLVIKRRDWPQEFRWTARYIEVKRDGPMWRERRTFMTQKVAISQGFRLCFGEELGGLPYTVEEMTNGAPPEPELIRPEEKQTVNTAVTVELVSDEVKDAQAALSLVYREMKQSKLFFAEELETYKQQAVAAKEDINTLNALRNAWSNELAARKSL